ncbi:MAG: DUF983 domain-containing protein [Acidimicrobiales bacterium]
MTTRPTPSRGTLLWRGFTRACAVCGERGLTRRGVTLLEDCPRCGFHFERKPGHFVGAVGMSTIATFGLLLITLVAGVAISWPDVSLVGLLLPMLPIAVLVPLLLHPTAKTLWVAVDLLMNPLEPGEAVGGTEERTAKKG